MFCFESIVRYSEIDADRFMTLPAILDILQDCCTFQSEEIGIGLDFLQQNHRAWILLSWQVVICRYPKFGETIRAYTWPYDFKSFLGYRNFKIEDAKGEVITYANSVWVYMDTENKRPVKVPEEVRQRYCLEAPFEMKYSDRKIHLQQDMEGREKQRVGRSQIDTNHHVNNSKYILMAEEYLPEGFQVKELRAEYKKEAVLGNLICPKVKETEHRVMVSLENERKEPYAVIEFMEDEG